MDHKYAIENHVAEGYLLDDLNERERDAYEDHFFGCSTCAEEVETVSAFIDTAKQVIREEMHAELAVASVAVPAPSWFQRITGSIAHPMPLAFASVLAVALGSLSLYQTAFVIPTLRTPHIASLGTPINSARGAVPVVKFSRGKAFPIFFEIPIDNSSSFTSYQVSIQTQSNVIKFSSSDIPTSQAKESLEIIVPADTLEPGSYTLHIDGTNENGKGKVEDFPFELKLQD